MGFTPPIQYGGIYHIYNRGNNRENLFIETRNYDYFLRLLVKHLLPVAELYAFCLLRNHFHLVAKIKTIDEQRIWYQENDIESLAGWPRVPSRHFSNWFNAYTRGFNKTYQRSGTLFQRPFSRKKIHSRSHFRRVIRYLHLNPIEHGFVETLEEWPFSSYLGLLSGDSSFLDREEVMRLFGGKEVFEDFHHT